MGEGWWRERGTGNEKGAGGEAEKEEIRRARGGCGMRGKIKKV